MENMKTARSLSGDGDVTLRPYRPSDCPGIAALFYDTVHTVNARDYTPPQLDAWASGEVDLDAWNASFLAHHTLVAVEGDTLVGFGDMDDAGYLDRLYVHRDRQGQGVATAICDALEEASSAQTLVTHASITAKPFFLRRGYRVVREQQVERREITLTNFIMEKRREMLDVVDENGLPTGEVIPRETAHARGVRHRTAHVWLVRCLGGNIQVLLQKRSPDKDSWPGCYDISSAGHIPAGADFIPSALRELQEELGVKASPGELIFCGNRRIHADGYFHGQPFHDRQYSRVFALRREEDEAAFRLQKEEIESVRWMDLDACIAAVKAGTIPNCIYPEELDMVRRVIT